MMTAESVSNTLALLGVSANVDIASVSSRLRTFRLHLKPGATVADVRRKVEDIGVRLELERPRLYIREGRLLLEVQRQEPVFPRFTDVFEPRGGRVLLGVDTMNRPVQPQLDDLPHIVVAGATGSGKSVALHTMICSLLASHTPANLRLLLVDPKGLEFARYAGLPHLAWPVESDATKTVALLDRLISEMERRYEALRHRSQTHQPRVVVVIDEFADLIGQNAAIGPAIKRLAQKARAAKIHIILATQRPSAKIIDGDIKANFPARLALRVSSSVDSRVVLGSNGAEALLGKGDAIYSNGPAVRLQVPMVSQETERKILSHYRG